jgi:hypothetical protein
MWNKKMAAGHATIEDIRKLYEQISQTADKVYEQDIKPTYEEEIEKLIQSEIHSETNISTPQNPQENTEETTDTAIQKAIEQQTKEQQKPKPKHKKINIEKLAEPTPEEIEQTLYKDMINKYAEIAVRMKNGEQQ